MTDAISDIKVRSTSPGDGEWIVFWKTINDTVNTESYERFTEKDEALQFAYMKARHPSQLVWVNGELAVIERNEANIVRGTE